ncbi:hypothetical protein CWI36_0083p0040 [Hamiltosporidium magnivora]|uniref:Uncharacterized protein n=1 Tax=Hamiltosporidium magnivora TaxID=148818 RepID=A0A4Q9LKV9_9MICR|nr:hypothetical protein CWI36_0083p0040 [Hamiltosporidium magnivora]
MKIESKEEIEKKRKSLAEQNPIFFIRLRRLVKIIFYTILINHVLGFLIQICFDINKTLSTQIRTIINFLLSNFYCLIVFYKKRANENRDYTYFCVNNTNGVLMNLFSIILSNVNDILKEKMFHTNRTVGYVEYFFMLTFLFVINSCVVYNSFLMIKFIENNLTKYPANICLTHLISAFLLFVGEKLIIMASILFNISIPKYLSLIMLNLIIFFIIFVRCIKISYQFANRQDLLFAPKIKKLFWFAIQIIAYSYILNCIYLWNMSNII